LKATVPGSQLLQASNHNTSNIGTEKKTLEFRVELEELVDIGRRHDTVVDAREVSVKVSPTKMSERVPDKRGQLVRMVLVATETLH
jgi:N12 class adenine-specific DNA methylase